MEGYIWQGVAAVVTAMAAAIAVLFRLVTKQATEQNDALSKQAEQQRLEIKGLNEKLFQQQGEIKKLVGDRDGTARTHQEVLVTVREAILDRGGTNGGTNEN